MTGIKHLVSWVWIDGSVEVGMSVPDGALLLVYGDMDDLKILFDNTLVKGCAVSDNVIDYVCEAVRDATTQQDKYVEFLILLNRMRSIVTENKLNVVIQMPASSSSDIQRSAIRAAQRRLH